MKRVDLTRWPGSWYADGLEDPGYPPLEGDAQADVCVIGAGFSGLNTALTLAERGRSVIVLEAGRIGWGASGRNGGQVGHGLLQEDRLIRAFTRTIGKAKAEALIAGLAWRGHEIIEDHIRRYAIDCDLHYGHATTASKRRHWPMLQAMFDEHKARDPEAPVRLVAPGDMAEVIASNAYHGALVNDRDMHLHPLKLCLGEARAAAGLGARIHSQSAATRIEQGETITIHTAKGSVRAKTLVLAGGAYHRLLRRRLDGYVLPAGSFILATEPLGDLAEQLIPEGRAIHDTNEIVDYFRCSADGRLLFGGRCNYTGHEPDRIEPLLRPRMTRIFPQLKDVKITHEWGGALGITVSRIPYLSRIGDNIWLQQGFSGHGVNTTHLFSEMLCDAICGDRERFDLFAGAPHWRLPGRWLGGRALAAGMTWFKLMDRL